MVYIFNINIFSVDLLYVQQNKEGGNSYVWIASEEIIYLHQRFSTTIRHYGTISDQCTDWLRTIFQLEFF